MRGVGPIFPWIFHFAAPKSKEPSAHESPARATQATSSQLGQSQPDLYPLLLRPPTLLAVPTIRSELQAELRCLFQNKGDRGVVGRLRSVGQAIAIHESRRRRRRRRRGG